jgi:hypothetical protein
MTIVRKKKKIYQKSKYEVLIVCPKYAEILNFSMLALMVQAIGVVKISTNNGKSAWQTEILLKIPNQIFRLF